jgi:hypothetical protein
VFEVLWQNFICKLVGFVNGKADAVGAPVYGGVIRRILEEEINNKRKLNALTDTSSKHLARKFGTFLISALSSVL